MKNLAVAFCTAALLSVGAPAQEEDPLFGQVQESTFQYFWDGAEPNSGLARERIHCDNLYPSNDRDVVTTGGSGFGLMAILVGIERGYITRDQALQRYETIATFLETCDRFHGAWPHWLDGPTGKVKPFGTKDDGGDLVESSFLAQGLLCVRQYFKDGSARQRKLAERMDRLWRDIDFDWYRNGKNVLYWHWSPNYAWQMNFPVHGYNECLIMYLLAASSPTHPVGPEVYHQGWAQNGTLRHPHQALGIPLQLYYQGDADNGGPLFWAHYSYLGLDPHGLKDQYADYEQETRNQARVNYQWCLDNPKHYKGYGPGSWGLTSSYSPKGYGGHAPDLKNDVGVISPTAALSSFPYLPREASAAMHHWQERFGSMLYGPYGPYDAFSETDNWMPPHYLAIDQGPIVVMMENHRTGLLWKLFMSCPEVQVGLKKLGFQHS
ncbi:beta-glucosidase [bacterium]|nr:beta-glucosidase [bacterium]